MPTGPALISTLHRHKKPVPRPNRPMSVPAMSSIADNRLSYDQAGTGQEDRGNGRGPGWPQPGGLKELMPFSSFLKGSAPKGKAKGKAKVGKGSQGASPLVQTPHSPPYSPPSRSSSTLPRPRPSSSAADTSSSIPSLVKCSLDLGRLSVSPRGKQPSLRTKERSKRVLGTPTKAGPVPKFRNPSALFRSPNKDKISPAATHGVSNDIPAFRIDSDGDGEGDSVLKIVNKNTKKTKPALSFIPF